MTRFQFIKMRSLLAVTTMFGACLPAISADADGDQVFVSKKMESFFESYCYNCHDSETEKGDFNLEDLTRGIANATDAAHWQDVLDQMNAGEMPPKKKKQPSKGELAAAIGSLTETLHKAQTVLKDSGGTIVPRRLNRREYVATIKDLMGIRVNPKTLPDDASGRFDTIGQNQSLNAMQLDKLFASQEFPIPDTKILRVNTTIQPGHSGAPIFSDRGRVVAIADGGLLDGWRGVNWSIPAYYYLPALAESRDPIPDASSGLNELFSQKTAIRTDAVSVGPAKDRDFQNLTLVRSLTLDDLDAIVPEDDFYADLFPAILEYAKDLTPSPRLSFDIYEDAVTGATLGIPGGVKLSWNDDLGVAEAIADKGAVRMFVGVVQAESHSEAKDRSAREFVARAGWLADWDQDPSQFTYDFVYDDETANFAGFFNGTDRATGEQVSLQLDIDVNGSNVLAWAVYAHETTSDEGSVKMMMMQLAGEKLSDYALK